MEKLDYIQGHMLLDRAAETVHTVTSETENKTKYSSGFFMSLKFWWYFSNKEADMRETA